MKKDYYHTHFLAYHEQTFNVNPGSFLKPLAICLKPGARILDVGCGSGRDLLWFKNKGFAVTGFERSSGLAQLARENVGCEIIEGDFENFDFSIFQADAVLSIGSLVHVAHDKMADILGGIVRSLKINGYLLITLKEGRGTKDLPDGRTFYLWTQESLTTLFERLKLDQIDFSRQVSKVRPDDVWIGHVLQKKT